VRKNHVPGKVIAWAAHESVSKVAVPVQEVDVGLEQAHKHWNCRREERGVGGVRWSPK